MIAWLKDGNCNNNSKKNQNKTNQKRDREDAHVPTGFTSVLLNKLSACKGLTEGMQLCIVTAMRL